MVTVHVDTQELADINIWGVSKKEMDALIKALEETGLTELYVVYGDRNLDLYIGKVAISFWEKSKRPKPQE